MLGRRLSDAEDSVRIDLSPMIDCVFILLIFFIVTTVFVEESGFEVNKPDSSGGGPTSDIQITTIEVRDDNTVYYNGRDIGIDGVQAIVKQSLAQDPEAPILIQGGEKARHDVFARVYGEVRLTGASKISFK
ncbi:MAG: biopolymer transporter ExbD [Opitutales bacterium]|nr:biopolymer transporter ExbD [Opitutales bacterium]